MLTLPISLLAPVSLVRSDRWLRHLLARCQQPITESGADDRTLARLALLDIQHCAPFPLRSNDADSALSLWQHQQPSLHSSQHSPQYSPQQGQFSAHSVLFALAETLLTWEGDCMQVAPGKLLQWQRLITKVDPTWVVAAGLLTRMRRGHLTDVQIQRLQQQDPQGFPRLWGADVHKPVADNHTHLGGHGGHSLSMLSFCLHLSTKPNIAHWAYHADFPLINRHEHDARQASAHHDAPHPDWNQFACLGNQLLPLILAHLPRASTPPASVSSLSGTDLKQNLQATHDAAPFAPHESYMSQTLAEQVPCWQTPEQWLPKAMCESTMSTTYPGPNNAFWQGMVDTQAPMASRWLSVCLLLLQHSAFATQSPQNASPNTMPNTTRMLGDLIDAFIHWSNILRSTMTVMGVGLTQFVDFFDAEVRGHFADYKDFSAQTDVQGAVYREFKVAPGALAKSGQKQTLPIRQLLKRLDTHYPDSTRTQLAMHLIRDHHSAAHKRHNNMQVVRQLQRLLQSNELQCVDSGSDDRPSVHRLRGFDVAGDENIQRIELFAPALRVLRNTGLSAEATYHAVKKRHFTIHAGEDYAHLLSGMRHIDETIRFCDFQPWDRIGHGLALGVDVDLWAQQQQVVYLPAGEWLDNLVWAHHYALQIVHSVPTLTPMLSLLQTRIATLSRTLWGEEYSAEVLFHAWQLRRNCPKKRLQAPELNDEQWCPDHQLLDEASRTASCTASYTKSAAVTLWDQYLDIQSGLRPRTAYDALIEIHLESTHDDRDKRGWQIPITTAIPTPLQQHDPQHTAHSPCYLSALERDFYSALQDWLMQRYSEMGIVFEACPTSNITIGRFQHYHQHPLFRWYPIHSTWLDEKYNRWNLRNGPLKVCVNTDDAGIMPTSIHNEHCLLRETAISEFNVTSEAADQWIDRLREIGVEAFER